MAGTKRPVVVTRIRLANPCVVGVSEVYHHIGKETHVDGGPIKIYFDEDPRFLRIESKHSTDLLPLSNVTSLRVELA